jgi:NADH:ubiquinone oxidoreductase subunit 6 (subunit J)
MHLVLAAADVTFKFLPEPVDVAIVPIFAGALAVVSGLLSMMLGSEDLGQNWLEGAVMGGTMGLGFLILGLLGAF